MRLLALCVAGTGALLAAAYVLLSPYADDLAPYDRARKAPLASMADTDLAASDLVKRDSDSSCDPIGLPASMAKDDEDRHRACADNGMVYSLTCFIAEIVEPLDNIAFECAINATNAGGNPVLVEPADFRLLTFDDRTFRPTDQFIHPSARFTGATVPPRGYASFTIGFEFPYDVERPLLLSIRTDPERLDAVFIIESYH